jgi:hypothetical protein
MLDVQERVALQVYAMVADAYGYVADRGFEEPCGSCGGDGCYRCWWTGDEPSSVSVELRVVRP